MKGVAAALGGLLALVGALVAFGASYVIVFGCEVNVAFRFVASAPAWLVGMALSAWGVDILRRGALPTWTRGRAIRWAVGIDLVVALAGAIAGQPGPMFPEDCRGRPPVRPVPTSEASTASSPKADAAPDVGVYAGAERPCAVDGDCTAPLRCIDYCPGIVCDSHRHECAISCAVDADCPEGGRCFSDIEAKPKTCHPRKQADEKVED